MNKMILAGLFLGFFLGISQTTLVVCSNFPKNNSILNKCSSYLKKKYNSIKKFDKERGGIISNAAFFVGVPLFLHITGLLRWHWNGWNTKYKDCESYAFNPNKGFESQVYDWKVVEQERKLPISVSSCFPIIFPTFSGIVCAMLKLELGVLKRYYGVNSVTGEETFPRGPLDNYLRDDAALEVLKKFGYERKSLFRVISRKLFGK